MADAKKKPPTGKPAFATPDSIVGNAQAGGQFANARYDIATDAQGNPAPPGQGYYGQFATAAADGTVAADWYKAYFGQYDLDPATQAAIVKILTQYAADPTTGQALATQYLRTTPWFEKTFPGFAAGVSNGLFTDETGYRSYLNTVNQVYNQYTNRHVSGDEISALLGEGAAPQLVANRFQGQAYVAANRPEIQYLGGAFGEGQLNPDQLTALGNEQAGIDTPMGQLQLKVQQKAQQIRDKLFGGQVATPNLSLTPAGVASPSLLGTRGTPDVAA